MLVQEMDAKVDMGFLMALIELFSSDALDRSQEVIVVELCSQVWQPFSNGSNRTVLQ